VLSGAERIAHVVKAIEKRRRSRKIAILGKPSPWQLPKRRRASAYETVAVVRVARGSAITFSSELVFKDAPASTPEARHQVLVAPRISATHSSLRMCRPRQKRHARAG
jgi:hypothetical protein